MQCLVKRAQDLGSCWLSKLEMSRSKRLAQRCMPEVEIGRYGKFKKIRTAPLINSLPYYKAGIAQHPMAGNPNAYPFISYGNSATYRNAPLGSTSLLGIYSTYLRKHHFPKLLERPDVPPEDKIKIKQLMQKPWNPYIRMHTGLHEKARLLNEQMLRQHAGWKKTSLMVEIYTHGLGHESSEDLLLVEGIDVKNINNKDQEATQQSLQPMPALQRAKQANLKIL
jgi:hypothetical protein